jgi:hypothetical protein
MPTAYNRGALELSKCFYYLLSWKWDKWGSPIPQTIKEQNLPPIKIIMSATKEIITLQQKEVQDSHRTLGTYKCIFGSETEQYTKLLEQSDNLTKKATLSQLNDRQAWLSGTYLLLYTSHDL